MSLTIVAPRSMRALGDGGLVGVDRDRHVDAPAQALEHRRDAPQLLVGRQRRRAGPRRLAADVDDVGAVRDHRERVGDRDVGIESRAAVGERIRRDVDDAHDERARAEVERAAVGKRNVK